MLICLLCLIALAGCDPALSEDVEQELKEEVTWKVANHYKNKFRNKTLEDLQGVFRASKPDRTKLKKRVHGRNLGSVPSTFDARSKWPQCIHSGRDQLSCGSCWAFGVTNHLSDRFCTMAGVDVVLSAQDLIECDHYDKCCNGGSPDNAYQFLAETGIVAESCKEYTQSCGTCNLVPSSCTHYKCEPDSGIWVETVADAKSEIYNNGPIMAIYSVYQDFLSYEGGVYYHRSGAFLGDHAVELLGWGRESGMNYWLVKNCWGDSWGDNGYFKIKMGDCGINDYMSTCTPQAP